MVKSPTQTAAPACPTTTNNTPLVKLKVPFTPKPPKQPNDGLLMGDPGPEYDTYECRLSIVEDMLFMASHDGCYTQMRNWKSEPVFVEGEDVMEKAARHIKSAVDNVQMGGTEEQEVAESAHETLSEAVEETLPWKDPSSLFRRADAEKKAKGVESDFGKGDGPAW